MDIKRTKRQGFTLVELMVVLFILVILASLVLPRFTRRTEDARVGTAKAQIANFESCLGMFEVDNGRYPTTEEGLAALVQAPSNAKDWHGPYLQKGVPLDPWHNPYVYQCPGQHNTNGYDIYSQGPSGHDNGETVNNWTQN